MFEKNVAVWMEMDGLGGHVGAFGDLRALEGLDTAHGNGRIQGHPQRPLF